VWDLDKALWRAGTFNGSVWSWGSDDNGQLGVVLTSSAATRPVNTIAAGSGIVQLAAGAEHMLALKSDCTVVAWDYNL